MNLSVADKLAIAPLLDELGVGFIEGGWPGAMPKDTEFFKRAAKELDFRNAELAAFGSTRKAGTRARRRPAGPGAARLRGARRHARRQARPAARERALRTTGEENLAMIARHRRVPACARGGASSSTPSTSSTATGSTRRTRCAAVLAGFEAGAEVVALCDTNGGMLPDVGRRDRARDPRRRRARRRPRHARAQRLRLRGRQHARRGRGRVHARPGHRQRVRRAHRATPTCCAVVANLAAQVRAAGARSRTGCPAGCRSSPGSPTRSARSRTSRRSRGSRTSVRARSRTRRGLHASAIKVDPDLYQHIDPTAVGNDMRMLISDMAGRASIELKGRELGFDLAGQARAARPGHRPGQGRRGAAATPTTRPTRRSSCCCARRSTASARSSSASSRWRAIVERRPATAARRRRAEATVKLHVGGERVVSDRARATARSTRSTTRCARRSPASTPRSSRFELIDFKVRILDTMHGTDAITRVLIETDRRPDAPGAPSASARTSLEASWEALTDSAIWGLRHHGVTPR